MSIFELTIKLLAKIFPSVHDRYYGVHGTNHVQDGIEHFFMGVICTLLAAVIAKYSLLIAIIFYLISAFIHIIYKEVIQDWYKRQTPHGMEVFKVDMILRIGGFIVLPWLLFV